jgi:serine/threonine protein kinase
MAIASSYAREPHELQELRRHRPAELQEIDLYVWHKRSVLGKGSFGTVYKGWSKRTFEGVAVKFVGHEVFANSPNGMDSLKREISIQRTLKDCVNILCLCHEEAISGGYVLITELCDKDLEEYIRELKGLRETDIKDFLQQMAAGLKVMHEKGFAHRDLKPENILLKKDPVTNKMIVKLADFGLARSYLNDSARKVKMMMTTAAGTPLFMVVFL